MNNLQLCQSAREKRGMTYTTTPTPTTTLGQTGALGRVVDDVKQAWITIQGLHPNWKFLRATKVQALTINVRTYNLITALSLQYMREFDKKGLFIEETSLDKTQLDYEEWEVFRIRVIQTTTGRPSVCSVNPDGVLEFDVIPDKAYVVRLSHWLTAEALDDDTDVPSFDEEYHEVIVWEATLRYCGVDTAGALYQHASTQRDRFLRRMEVRYLPLPASVDPYPLTGMR